jgi:hypothetical protein
MQSRVKCVARQVEGEIFPLALPFEPTWTFAQKSLYRRQRLYIPPGQGPSSPAIQVRLGVIVPGGISQSMHSTTDRTQEKMD